MQKMNKKWINKHENYNPDCEIPAILNFHI